MLAARRWLALRQRRLERRDQNRPRPPRLDHVVDVAPLGRGIRIGEALLVLLDQLGAADLGVDPVADWVLHHHERWDGTGYPNGLQGDDIPLGARIIFVADAFDAMTSDRVYRRRLSTQHALAELSACSGTQFDPEIVTAFADELGALPIVLASTA